MTIKIPTLIPQKTIKNFVEDIVNENTGCVVTIIPGNTDKEFTDYRIIGDKAVAFYYVGMAVSELLRQHFE